MFVHFNAFRLVRPGNCGHRGNDYDEPWVSSLLSHTTMRRQRLSGSQGPSSKSLPFALVAIGFQCDP